MKALVDCIHYSEEMCGKLEFSNTLFENLEPYPEDIFVRQMDIQVPGFSKYVVHPPWGDFMGYVMVGNGVLDLADEKQLSELAQKFSYRLANLDMKYGLVFKPDHARAEIPLSTKYIHLSPVDDLQRTGIRCKASRRFEAYTPRIYLLPLGTLVDHHLPPDEMYDQTMEACRKVARRFNDVYVGNRIIPERESYFVYLVNLPEAFQVYDDMSSHDGSVYVINEIPPVFIQKMGRLEKP